MGATQPPLEGDTPSYSPTPLAQMDYACYFAQNLG